MRKLQVTVLSLVVAASFSPVVFAEDVEKSPSNSSFNNITDPLIYKQIRPQLIYSYVDFNFNAVSGFNSNSYQGYSNIFAAGADNIQVRNDIIAGLYYFNVSTAFNSEILLNPTPLVTSEQTIKNNTVFGHLLKIINPQWFVDFAGGYGQNQLTMVTNIESTNPLAANTTNNNWFLSLNALYRKTWDNILFKGNVGALYSQINTGSYQFIPFDRSQVFTVAELVNKATLIIENAELVYTKNAELMPFVNGALIQVAQFSNSRPVLDPAVVINGSLPQINLNQGGFRLGAGIAFKHKQLNLRLEEKYYNSVGTFISYQTFLGLEYEFT